MHHFVSGTSLFNSENFQYSTHVKYHGFLQHFIIFLHQFLKQFSQFGGNISMLLCVKIWRCVKVDVFLVVDGWNDKECYPLRK